jgi:hypothetical protein
MGDNLPDDQKGLLPEISDPEAYLKTLLLVQSLHPKTLLGSHCDEVSADRLEPMLKSLTSRVKV